jgi:acyl-CoA synthetase (AMP-forming)/AMP-acid ligase II
MLEVPDMGFKPTIGETLKRAAERWSDTDFIVMPDTRITFGEAEERSRSLAKKLLASGLGKGSRVGIFDTYSTEWVITWLATVRIGALAMPFSSIYKEAELRTVTKIGDVHTLLAPSTVLGKDIETFLETTYPGLADQKAGSIALPAMPFLRSIWLWGDTDRPWATSIDIHATDSPTFITDEILAEVEEEVKPADFAQVTYTSGSSALPKGVVHSHGTIVRTTGWTPPELVEQMKAAGMLGPATMLNGFPFFWIGGTLVLGIALQRGSTVCCLPKFEAGPALDMIEREKPTSVMAWPALTQAIKAHPEFLQRDLSSVPMLTEEGPSDMMLRDTPVPGVPGHRSMSELVGNWNGSERKAVDPDKGGHPLPDLEEGELWVRGHGLMQGYYKKEREEVFDEDGWLHTGDKVFMSENRPYFVGRFYEMIKSQGANVSPREVELQIELFPEVEHALVFGMPHETLEEEVTAIIVFKPGREMSIDDLQARARADMSSYKVPTRIVVVDHDQELPWLGSGKPDKLKLAEMLETGELEDAG